jgi:type II secretory pathway pseudopilin PulG
MINKKQTIQKGFTLIEVLIAVFILITAVVVPLTIGSKGIFYSNFVRDQSIASYLVQEGMESVRLTRDNVFLIGSANNNNSDDTWQNFVSTVSNCESDINSRTENGCWLKGGATFSQCGSSGCEPLGIDSDGHYVSDGGDPSAFIRTIKTQSLTNPSRMRVDVTVSWKTNTLDRQITVTNYLTPWQI